MDSCSSSSIGFLQPNPSNEIAYIVENNAIIGFLANRIKQNCPNVTVKMKAKVTECKVPLGLNEFATIVLDDGTKLKTSLIIGADGARSHVRNVLNFKYTNWEYGQTAVVANLQVQASENNSVAWQRFTPNGPVALLPLTENMSSVTWSTNPKHALELLSLPPEQFVDQLNEFLTTDVHQDLITNQFLSVADQVLGGLFGINERPKFTVPEVISVIGDTRAAFPLGFGYSHSYISSRVALIGDAAHRTHPLAGQGVNLGWSDVKVLLKCLEKCVIDGGDLGSITYLSDYDAEGQRRNVPVQVACDWLNRLYLTSSTPLILLRSCGLNLIDRVTPLKVCSFYDF
ncbi:unnamed protein product [Thelazia callipaeda]|uniref:Ubiquinone biosynthesis monooxygenase COQ6, mitochondrial n=1 Tax=Thelazia callipaeda TaxID=103827 RepID=A0A0N5CNJ3_THECL|nr:unnamed protein product [Thelazia callipaeda]